MLVIMKSGASREEISRVVGVIQGLGNEAERLPATDREMLRISGYVDAPHPDLFEALPGVCVVLPTHHPTRRVDRGARAEETRIRVGKAAIGGGRFTIIAGPCAVESEEQLLDAARRAADAGADLLRGGAYKPRTSPFEFQGMEEAGLQVLARAREETGLPFVTEAVCEESLARVRDFADVIQVGARNMQNFQLLKALGRVRQPVLLKRGISATLEEFLMAAEYVMDGGNPNVILCERGIRTFSNHSRFTLDIAAIPLLKHVSHLPVIVDPSHASGRSGSVPALARAALAAGADGVMIELHPDPLHALCDGFQSLTPEAFASLAESLRALEPLIARQREPVS